MNNFTVLNKIGTINFGKEYPKFQNKKSVKAQAAKEK